MLATEVRLNPGAALFADAPAPIVQRILEGASFRDLAPGDVLSPGDSRGTALVLLDGRLHPAEPDAGESRRFEGLTWLTPRIGSTGGRLRADGPCRIMAIPRERLTEAADASHAVALALSRALLGADISAASTADAAAGASPLATVDLLERQVARCRDARQPLAVLMVSIDHWDALVRQQGFATAAARVDATRRVVEALVRPGDRVAPWGEDGLVVSLPGVVHAEAASVVLRLRAALVDASGDRPVSFSAGLAQLAAEDSAQSLLDRAREALRRVRSRGPGCFGS